MRPLYRRALGGVKEGMNSLFLAFVLLGVIFLCFVLLLFSLAPFKASFPTWVPFIVYLSKLYASHLYPAVRSLWPEGSGLRGIAEPS